MAVLAISILAIVGAALIWKVDRALDRDARVEQQRIEALLPLAMESAGDGRRVSIEEVEPLTRAIGHPLPARVTGLVAPLGAGARGGDVALAGPAWRHQWPGVYFEARFRGDSVAIAFDDPRNRYRVALDGGRGPVFVLNRSGRYGLRMSGLGPGPHEVRVDRISESLSGAGTFLGFFVASREDALPAPPPRPRAVEVIGDSDSVGFGNRSERRDCTGEDVFLLTDTQAAFGPQVARHFGADYQLNAISGIGLVRNDRGTNPGRTMSVLHGRPLLDEATPVGPPEGAPDGTPAWAPDLIVVALGSNDFASELAPSEEWRDPGELRDEFARRYVRFLRDLRRQHPRAFLLSLAWEEYGADYLTAHRAAVAELKAGGDARLDQLVLPPMTKTGCLWHPNRADHEEVADALIRYVEARPDVWVE